MSAALEQSESKAGFSEAFLAAVRAVVGKGSVSLHEPTLDGHEKAYLADCIDSTFVSSVGAYVDRFESELAALTGADRAVAMVNGTAALQIALVLAGVEAGDEVLVPSLSFVATANAVSHCGAVPHFVDCCEQTLGLDAAALEEYLARTADVEGGRCINRQTGRTIRAVVPMHTFGHPVEMAALLAVSRSTGLAVVEDAAESLGSLRDGQHTGTFGELGALSFNGNKIVTTGGGGAILTDDKDLADQAKHLTTTAKLPHGWRYEHDQVGYNYRMPNLNAALGCAQLERLPGWIEDKRHLFEKYREAFDGLAGVEIFEEPEGCRSNYWLHAAILDRPDAGLLETVLVAGNAQGLQLRPAWEPLHRLAPYRHCPCMPLLRTEALAARIINLPSSPGLARRGAV